jgi:hypothetical protein
MLPLVLRRLRRRPRRRRRCRLPPPTTLSSRRPFVTSRFARGPDALRARISYPWRLPPPRPPPPPPAPSRRSPPSSALWGSCCCGCLPTSTALTGLALLRGASHRHLSHQRRLLFHGQPRRSRCRHRAGCHTLSLFPPLFFSLESLPAPPFYANLAAAVPPYLYLAAAFPPEATTLSAQVTSLQVCSFTGDFHSSYS